MKKISEMGKIEAIKLVRQMMLDTFGVTAGLRETKDYIEHMLFKERDANLDKVIRDMRGTETRDQMIARVHRIYSEF